MFNNLIESQSHRKEFRRRGRFLAVTSAVYTLLFLAAGIGSIYAYDARLEAQNDDLIVLGMVPEVAVPAAVRPQPAQHIRRPAVSNAPIDPSIRVAERTNPTTTTNDPTSVPDAVGTRAGDPPVVGPVNISLRNADPPSGPGDPGGCTTCTGTGTVVVPTVDPQPAPVKPPVPPTRTVTSIVLTSKVVSMPKPLYPSIARSARAQGPVNVQILVDEQGKVISAHAVNGHPLLTAAASQAAFQARFTPTTLNGTPVKIQGVITYNFVLQ